MEERPQEERPMEEKTTGKKTGKELSPKKLIAIRVLGGFLTVAFLFLAVLFESITFGEISFSIDPKTLEVTYTNLTVVITWLSLAIMSILCAVAFFGFLALKHFKVRCRIVCAGILLIVSLIGILVIGLGCYSALQFEIELKKKDFPIYTEVIVSDLLMDVNRFPKKYEGVEISLEGYASACDENMFILLPPSNRYNLDKSERIVVQYVWDDSSPRVLNKDYVVVTGTVTVFYSEKDEMYKVAVISARCEIKEPR